MCYNKKVGIVFPEIGGDKMHMYLSDDQQNVIVVDDRGDDEVFTREEFISAYGEDALPQNVKLVEPTAVYDKCLPVAIRSDLDEYYDDFRKLCEACGKFAWADKLGKNASEGIFPTQKVKHDYYGGTKGNADVNLSIAISNAKRDQLTAIRDLNFCSVRLGFKPMSDQDMDRLLNHLYDGEFRDRLRYRIDRNRKNGVLASARELVLEVLQSLKAP